MRATKFEKNTLKKYIVKQITYFIKRPLKQKKIIKRKKLAITIAAVKTKKNSALFFKALKILIIDEC